MSVSAYRCRLATERARLRFASTRTGHDAIVANDDDVNRRGFAWRSAAAEAHAEAPVAPCAPWHQHAGTPAAPAAPQAPTPAAAEATEGPLSTGAADSSSEAGDLVPPAPASNRILDENDVLMIAWNTVRDVAIAQQEQIAANEQGRQVRVRF